MNLLQLELWYSTPFWNAKAMNESEEADFANFHRKIDCRGKSLGLSEKQGKISNQMPTVWWNNMSQMLIWKKKRGSVRLSDS